MQYRNIRRAFLFNRALERMALGAAQVNILFAIASLQRPTYSTITKFLKHNRRSVASTLLIRYLDELVADSYARKSEQKVFSLSSLGHCTLLSLEQIARKLRPDK